MKTIKRQLSSIEATEWPQQINQLKDQVTFYPKTIGFEDIDSAIDAWVRNKSIIINDRILPVFYLTPEKWAEFKQRWTYMDQNRNIEYPYITLRRLNFSRVQKSNIPSRKFDFYRVPVNTNAGVTYKKIRIQQPIKIEINYELRALTHKNIDSNKINEEFLRYFASIQAYLDIDKHYMPIEIESISDESNLEANKEKVLHTLFNLKVKGYLLNEKDFSEETGVASIVINIQEF